MQYLCKAGQQVRAKAQDSAPDKDNHLLGELPLPLGKLLLQYAVKVFTIWGKGRYNIG